MLIRINANLKLLKGAKDYVSHHSAFEYHGVMNQVFYWQIIKSLGKIFYEKNRNLLLDKVIFVIYNEVRNVSIF